MKDKAILVMDMPESCAECSCFREHYLSSECRITEETMDFTFNPYQNKMDKCPLKPMPEKYDIPSDDFEYEIGFNRCIDEILGGEE